MLQTKKITLYLCVFIGVLGLTLTGCKSTSIDDSVGEVTLQFQTTTTSSTSAKSSANLQQQTDDTLRIDGSNGTLVIDGIWFIVEDFELERTDGACEGLEDEQEDACEEFESEPLFVDLPLQGDVLNLDTSLIESGFYQELEFEIDDLDLDEEEDPEEQQSKQDLINLVRSEFPDWPDEVSAVVTGSFVSSQGDTTAFKVFAEAEVEIELEFSPPLEVSENTVNSLLKINIDPVRWFKLPDGTVIDLSQYDYDSTGQVLEFEVEIENGFESIEVDDEGGAEEEDD